MPVVQSPSVATCFRLRGGCDARGATETDVGLMPCGGNEHRGRFFLSCSNPCDIHVAEAGVNKKSTSCDVLSL